MSIKFWIHKSSFNLSRGIGWRMAVKKYEEALLLWRAIGARDGEAATLNNIGLVYESLGEKQKALEFYAQADAAVSRSRRP